LRVEVTENGVEVRLSRRDVGLLTLSALLLAFLLIGAGWEVASIALGLSVAGAGAIANAPRA
jgi:hypothetical protein